MICAIVLTFNSEASIARTLAPLKRVTSRICVVDSFSSDNTVQICRDNGCEVVQRPFSTYSDQRNWAIEHFRGAADWQLHVDADEELDDDLVTAIKKEDLEKSDADGYIVIRRIVFMNKVLKFGGISKTWHMRLFRSGKGKVEDRLYDQHFICFGQTRVLNGSMLDHQEMSLSEWTSRHNRWSDLEVRELSEPTVGQPDKVEANRHGNVIERKRYHKGLYYKAPLFWRSFLYFVLRYVFLLGFLDGTEGFIYHVLQGLWFRFLVDAKLFERRLPPAVAGRPLTSPLPTNPAH